MNLRLYIAEKTSLIKILDIFYSYTFIAENDRHDDAELNMIVKTTYKFFTFSLKEGG